MTAKVKEMGRSSCFKPMTMIFLALLSFTVFQSGNTQRPNLNPAFTPVDNSPATRYNFFDLELLQGFDDNQNYFISPASIKTTLGMVLEGARGQCAKEISDAIRIPLDPSTTRNQLQSVLYNLYEESSSTVVHSANAAFISKLHRIIPEYKQNIEKYYLAEVHPIDFTKPNAASSFINTWVKSATRGVIPEIVSPDTFTADATLVLANALYFKGQWKNEFEERSTAIKCFHTRKHGCINAKMMQTVDNFHYKFIDELDTQAIQLPYGEDKKYVMLVLLPSEKHSIEGLTKDLQHFSFANIVNRLEPTDVSVNLPKFNIDYSGDIVPLLKTLGVKKIFNQNANLSGIVEKGQVKVNNIIHKAKIEVNEKGITNAAEPGIIATRRFIADGPFLFFIYHVPTTNIIFEGRVNEVPETYDEISTKPHRQPVSQNQPINQVHNQPPIKQQDNTVFPVFQSGSTQRRPSFNLENYFNEELLTGFDDTQNYFISPASIKATLGMVLESSRGHGAVEISKAIGFSLDQSRIRRELQNMLYDLNDNAHGTTVQSVNAAFLSKLYAIIPEYQQNIRRYYSADVHSIDFSNPSIASNTINSWVRTSTNGLIPAIVSPEIFNADTEFVLANALNFKGQWKFEFDERHTAIKCFHTLKHGCINAKMMQTVGQFKYKSFDEISTQAIQLPYGDGRYAMVVLLPSEKDAVEDLIKDLQHYSLPSILRRLELRDVLVNLPKFEIDYRGDIAPLLKKLGVKKIFNRNANLSGIAENGQVKVNNFIHKAKVEVNEKETIAAAAPIIDMGSSMSRFMADHPFLFFIYHVATSNILFEGRLNEVPEVYNLSASISPTNFARSSDISS